MKIDLNILLSIRSWRVRSALAWVWHHAVVVLLPATLLGAMVMTGQQVPEWLRITAITSTSILSVAWVLGLVLHRELDAAGVPCRWCEAEWIDDSEIEI
ncbi:hypothetical protein ACFV4P_34435 [Kitasatospora sp. NPDC059795]|uniref:hypothetical protein n=1 Tax=Kitasatospora sp. NPDC059795 TaxID=3346949 RepID=UPI00365F23FB